MTNILDGYHLLFIFQIKMPQLEDDYSLLGAINTILPSHTFQNELLLV